jgi:recombination protein RecT
MITQAVSARQKEDQLIGWLRQRQDDIAMAAATHIKPSAIIRVTQGALRRDPKLAAAAIANPFSLLNALLDCARLGHEPDTDDYYLVPFGDEVTGIEGYKGIIERMYRAGGVTSVVAQVVHLFDRYTPRGQNEPPWHEYDDFAPPRERGPMRGAYAYAILREGQCSQVIRMGHDEIMQHKAMSRGSGKPDSPWQKWESSMWKKTVLRALEPYVPTSTEYRGTPPGAAPAKDGGNGIAYLVPPPVSVRPLQVASTETGPERPSSAVPDEQSASGPAADEGPGTPEDGQYHLTETDIENEPGSASKDQLTRLHTILTGLGFGGEDREQKLVIAEMITGRAPLHGPKRGRSSGNLSYTEADTLIRKLDEFVDENGERDRDALIAYMAEHEQAGEADG